MMGVAELDNVCEALGLQLTEEDMEVRCILLYCALFECAKKCLLLCPVLCFVLCFVVLCLVMSCVMLCCAVGGIQFKE